MQMKVRDNAVVDGLLLMESAAFAYSAYREWGVRLTAPLGVILEDTELLDDFIMKMGIFQKRILTTSMALSRLCDELCSYRDDVCPVLYIDGPISVANLEMLEAMCASGTYNGSALEAPIILIFSKVIPPEAKRILAWVLEVKQSDLDSLEQTLISNLRDYLQKSLTEKETVICESLEANSNLLKDVSAGRFWTAVICSLTFNQKEGLDDVPLKEYFSEICRQACNRAETYEFAAQIPELFCRAFDKAIPEICHFILADLVLNVPADEAKKLIVVMPQSYLVPETVFCEICREMTDIASINEIKAVLAEAGIVYKQGRKRTYYTEKRRVGTPETSARYLRFNREVLEENLEISFWDLFQIRSGHE